MSVRLIELHSLFIKNKCSPINRMHYILLAEYTVNNGVGLSANTEEILIIIPLFCLIIFGTTISHILTYDNILTLIKSSFFDDGIFSKYSSFGYAIPTLFTRTSTHLSDSISCVINGYLSVKRKSTVKVLI